MTISTTGTDPDRTAAVANVFGQSIIDFFAKQQEQRAASQIATVTEQLKKSRTDLQKFSQRLQNNPDDVVLQAQRDSESSRYGSLYSRLQTLFTEESAGAGLSFLQKAVPVPQGSSGFSAPSTRWGRVRLGLLIGLLLGCVLALVLERFDTRLRTRAAAQEALRLPILAEIPRLPSAARRGHAVVSKTMPGSAAAEAFRSLRSSLLLLPSAPIVSDESTSSMALARSGQTNSAPPKVVLVVSAREGEGKTSTVVNVAAAMAEAGKRVLVLDCDFRSPEAHLYLDVPNGSGLSDMLDSSQGQELLSLSRPTAVPGVRLVTGGRTDHTSALPMRMAQIVAEARTLADIVLIDTTPMLVANDAIDLMPSVDTVLLVARSGRTTKEQAERTVELLARMRVPVSGVALIGSGQPALSLRLPLNTGNTSSGSRARRKTRLARHTTDLGAR